MKKILLCALALSMLSVATTNAASRKKISNVNITVKGGISAGDLVADTDDLEVDSHGNKYSCSGYDFTNGGFQWYEDDIPELEVMLECEEGYYFNVTKESQVRIHGNSGAVFKKAKREDNGNTLIVTLRLPPLSDHVAKVENLTFDQGVLSWDPVACAEEYEVKLMKSKSTPGGIQVVHGTSIDLNHLITAGGTYTCRVRAINKYDHSIIGDWSDRSEDYTPGEAVLQANRDKFKRYNNGTWEMVDNTWVFTDDDGTKPSGWIYYKNDWYYLEDGRAAAGTKEIDGQAYHFDAVSAKLLRNIKLPDGTELDTEGKPYAVHSKDEMQKRADAEEKGPALTNKQLAEIEEKNMRDEWLRFQGKDPEDEEDREDRDED